MTIKIQSPRQAVAWLGFFFLLLDVAAPRAADVEVPLDLQAKLFLAALAYDKTLEARAATNLNIGLLFFPGAPHSEVQARDLGRELEQFKDKKVGGLSFSTVAFAYTGAEALRGTIKRDGLLALYIAQGPPEQVRQVTAVTRSEKAFSLSSNVEHVICCGVSLAIGLQDNKPKIYLNMSAAQLEGAEFGAKFLRIVHLVE
jgi:hypothetical protein